MKIYERSYLRTNRDTVTVSSGDDLKANLYDNTTLFSWVSIGEAAGTSTITLKLDFSLELDRLVLQGINWKDYTIDHSADGISWTNAFTITSNTDSYGIHDVTVTKQYWRFQITARQVVGDETICAQILLLKSLFTLTPNGIKPVQIEKKNIVTLADAGTNKNLIGKKTEITSSWVDARGSELTNINSLMNKTFVITITDNADTAEAPLWRAYDYFEMVTVNNNNFEFNGGFEGTGIKQKLVCRET